MPQTSEDNTQTGNSTQNATKPQKSKKPLKTLDEEMLEDPEK